MRAFLDVVKEKKSISALPRVEPNSELKFMYLAGNRTANRTAKPHTVAVLSFNVSKNNGKPQCDTHIGKEMNTGDMIEVVDAFVYLGTCITNQRGKGQKGIALPTSSNEVNRGTQANRDKTRRFLTPEDGTDRLSRNVRKKLPLLAA